MNTTNALPKQTRLVSHINHNGLQRFRVQTYGLKWHRNGWIFSLESWGRFMTEAEAEAEAEALGLESGDIEGKIVTLKKKF